MLSSAAVGMGQLHAAAGFFNGNVVQGETAASGIPVRFGGQEGDRIKAGVAGVPTVGRMTLSDGHDHCQRRYNFGYVYRGFQWTAFRLNLNDVLLDDTFLLGGIRVDNHRRLPGDARKGVGNFAKPGLVGAPAVKKFDRWHGRKDKI